MKNIKKKYKGIEYIIHWFNEMGHYNGYVKIPDNHPDNKKVDKTKKIFGRDCFTGYDDINIDCHGGLTFSRRITSKNKDDFSQDFSEGAWIGWDYAHGGDETNFSEGYIWTDSEVEKECKNVIEQLLKNKLMITKCLKIKHHRFLWWRWTTKEYNHQWIYFKKDADKYKFRVCEKCGVKEILWRERKTAGEHRIFEDWRKIN